MKGICFIEPLFNSTIKELKEQTRRIINDKTLEKLDEYWSWREFALSQQTFGVSVEPDATISFARYKVGEILYLKEPYIRTNHTIYKYSEDKNTIEKLRLDWQNKLFMPEKYARYFIEITDVRCERLQDISDDDCLKEGIVEAECISERHFEMVYENGLNSIKSNNGFLLIQSNTPKEAYAALIDKINGKGTWESNPFVWVYDYKLLK